MPKSLRQQLADANQMVRDLKTEIHQIAHPLQVRIAHLESENAKLRRTLHELGRSQHSIRVLATTLQREATANDALIEIRLDPTIEARMLDTLATGNRSERSDR